MLRLCTPYNMPPTQGLVRPRHVCMYCMQCCSVPLFMDGDRVDRVDSTIRPSPHGPLPRPIIAYCHLSPGLLRPWRVLRACCAALCCVPPRATQFKDSYGFDIGVRASADEAFGFCYANTDCVVGAWLGAINALTGIRYSHPAG